MIQLSKKLNFFALFLQIDKIIIFPPFPNMPHMSLDIISRWVNGVVEEISKGCNSSFKEQFL